MYLTNQLFSNLSPKIDLINIERYIEENLDKDVRGSVLIDQFHLVDDFVLFRIIIRDIHDGINIPKREDQVHTISKSLLVRLGYYKF